MGRVAGGQKMDLEANEFYNECLAQATMVVKQVRTDQFALPTPDIEWNVRDLVTHMLYELEWVPDIVEGKTIQEVGNKYGGDLFGESDIDLATEWELAATKAEQAVNDADLDATAHLSYGNVSMEKYLREAGSDQLIHAWDLGQAIGVTVTFDPDIAESIYDDAKERVGEMRASGLFAPPKQAPETADIQTKLLALYGRSADTWREEQ